MIPTPTVSNSNRAIETSIEPLPESERGRIWTDATNAESARLRKKQFDRRRWSSMPDKILVLVVLGLPNGMQFFGFNREVGKWASIVVLSIWAATCCTILFISWRRTDRNVEREDDVEFELAQTKTVLKERGSERLVDPDDPEAILVLVATKGKHEVKPNKIVDGGLLRVDSNRRLLLLEGDECRYRIPGDAIIDCVAMKGWFQPNVVLLKVQDPAANAILEFPIIPRCAMDGLPVAHSTSKSVAILYDRIRAICCPLAS